MELYIRFIGTLAFGLIGLGMVLKVLLEGLFNEWDAFNDIAGSISLACSGRGGHVRGIRAEDILLEAEEKNACSLNTWSTRLVDQKRRQIHELDAIEARVVRVHAPGPITEPAILPS